MEGGMRVPMIIRWPGKIAAGKVENGIMSGLDFFPTFVAAAGNPNIKDELLKGEQLGDSTYKVHLDGYNQLDFLLGKESPIAMKSSTSPRARWAPCASTTGSTE